jgi:hypothetical protein
MTKRGKRVPHDKKRKEGATRQREERGCYLTKKRKRVLGDEERKEGSA